MTTTCQHGMDVSGCVYCVGVTPAAAPAVVRRAAVTLSRQRLLDDLCAVLGVARHVETPGSSPSRVFEAAAKSAGVPTGSMPEIGAAIAAKAGLEWGPGCDNRGHHRDATGVTAEGIALVRTALTILAARGPEPRTKRRP